MKITLAFVLVIMSSCNIIGGKSKISNNFFKNSKTTTAQNKNAIHFDGVSGHADLGNAQQQLTCLVT